jgi:tetratricopeptide (TPR) repeat protein
VIIGAFAAIPVLSFFGPFVVVFCAVILSAIWTPHIGATFAKPITSLFDGGDLPPEDRPAYSVAMAKQKRGDYIQAIAEIRKQLERFPTDLEGQLLLAQIQAENLKDLPGAELTIQRFCDQPHHAPKNIMFALLSMADWHLQFGQDREAARRNLQKIIDLLPDTEFSLTAAQRIAHLGTAEMLLSPHDRKKYIVPEAQPHFGLVKPAQSFAPVEQEPGVLATEYVSHLKFHPLDTEVREKLARLYVDHYHRLDLAADQLEQMIVEPHQPARLIVHWLNLMADLQIRSGCDFETVKETLQRIIDSYPKLAAAEIARKRLDLLKLELKGKQQTAAVKLGTYEQKIGLKEGTRKGYG